MQLGNFNTYIHFRVHSVGSLTVVYTEFDDVLCHCVDLHNATTRRTVARGPVRKNWFSQQRLNISRMLYAMCAVM